MEDRQKRLRRAYVLNQTKFIDYYLSIFKELHKEGKGLNHMLKSEVVWSKANEIREIRLAVMQDFGEDLKIEEFQELFIEAFNTFTRILSPLVCTKCKKEGKIEEAKSNIEEIINNICNNIKL